MDWSWSDRGYDVLAAGREVQALSATTVSRLKGQNGNKERVMGAEATQKMPRVYWVVSILALVWMLFGVLAWVMDLMTDDAAMAGMSEARRQLYVSRPQWLFGVYAVAIFSGLAG